MSAEGSKPPDLAVEEARRALESEAAEAERETVAAEREIIMFFGELLATVRVALDQLKRLRD